MKKLLTLTFTLLTLALTAAAELPRPKIVDAQRIINVGWIHLSWDTIPAPPTAAVEIQRKLFLWGWRTKGTLTADNVAWADHNPAKRQAVYRMRVVNGTEKGPWSNVVKVGR